MKGLNGPTMDRFADVPTRFLRIASRQVRDVSVPRSQARGGKEIVAFRCLLKEDRKPCVDLADLSQIVESPQPVDVVRIELPADARAALPQDCFAFSCELPGSS